MATSNNSHGRQGPRLKEKSVRKRISSLKPSPENEKLYRLVDEYDPEIQKLADSIEKIGLRENITITADSYVVSGHRRLTALKLLDRKWVTVRVLAVRRDEMITDQYIELLREHNRHRHKSVAEQIREEVLDADPTDAHLNLQRYRERSTGTPEHNGIEELQIEGCKVRHAISDQKAEHVKYVKQVVFEDRYDYWPLSVRGIHYPLLNYSFLRNIPRKLKYLNDDHSYQATSNLLTRLRLTGEIPWDAIDDGTRPLKEFQAFHNAQQFVRQEMDRLFDGYWRDLLQSQPNHIEVLCEKNTVYHMVLQVTKKYQINTISGRGFCSITPWYELYQRYLASGKERLIIIVLSDFDPEGEMIPQVGGRTLRDDFGAKDVTIIKAGVTAEQIEQYNLPPQNFAKETSSNHAWFVDRTGKDAVYELEALEPADMLQDLESVITSTLDMELFNMEVEREKEEATYLNATRKVTAEALKGIDM